MALTTAQRNTINTWLNGAWTRIQARQAQYLADRGHYRQFKRSHTIPPQSAATVLPDNLSDQPTNEQDGVTLTHANGGSSWPCSVTVDVYDGPLGAGYVATARGRDAGGLVYAISRQVGPETWREHNWRQEA
jgi:hypothetical protein